ncbi:transporter substrate-binding domain-containing protein [Pigmentibacter sp. JX0631]|uniref:substrate-binding periplasmic protein n=1 Tax=Pigmentibacter sp. JX0631 TaxID=2976982 RepID=UPI0024694AAF|nr:transporter substrate-binding domain-containing protein [Pigmentibacter sp. JX0631]WGL58773.1 transporter substrate-binding domain-containing protein [Pigmentibacter sp. JX0631]
MHKFLKYFLFLVITNYSIALKAQSIKLCYPDNDTSPLQVGHGDLVFNPPGITVDIVNEAAKNLKINVIFVREPISRIFDSLKRGKIDGAFIFSYTKERAEVAEYPIKNSNLLEGLRLIKLSNNFYTLSDSLIEWRKNNLVNNKESIGVLRGHAVIGTLKEFKIPYEESSTLEMMIKKLINKRISAFVGQSIIVDNFLKKNNISGIKKLSIPITTKNYYLIFSKSYYANNKNLANKFWDEVSKIREKVISEKFKNYEK